MSFWKGLIGWFIVSLAFAGPAAGIAKIFGYLTSSVNLLLLACCVLFAFIGATLKITREARLDEKHVKPPSDT
jgi:hypothetical protein